MREKNSSGWLMVLRPPRSAWEKQLQSVRRAESAPDVNIGVTFSYVSHQIPKTRRYTTQPQRRRYHSRTSRHVGLTLRAVRKAGRPGRRRRRGARGGISSPYCGLQKGAVPLPQKKYEFCCLEIVYFGANIPRQIFYSWGWLSMSMYKNIK